ncbi:MAG: pentapeptide repeat-containing protein [Nitrospirae bacterium]|nr:pentapeptide repeat-containing protein [Nitrospirota bacterium]
MDRDGYKFDLVTQRFIINRWETETGQKVREDVIQGLKNSVEVRAILDSYVLAHPENVEPYGYPHYPKNAMTEGGFWVLTNDDLRGINFFSEDFSGSPSFEKKSLTYSSFFDCNLTDANFEMTDLSYARFDNCKMDKIILAGSGGFSTKILNSSVRNACIWKCGFRDCDFSGSDFFGAYLEDIVLEDITVNYLTRFDIKLSRSWKKRARPMEQDPDIFRAIRLAYGRAELWSLMDQYLVKEKRGQRKHILWPQFRKEKTIQTFIIWVYNLTYDLVSVYSTMPRRILSIGFAVAILFSTIYRLAGTANELPRSRAERGIKNLLLKQD